MNTIATLEWHRARHLGDLVASLDPKRRLAHLSPSTSGIPQLRILAVGRAGLALELWEIKQVGDDISREYLGWFAHEDEAKAAARTHVGDDE